MLASRAACAEAANDLRPPPIAPETLTVEQAIKPGPNIFVGRSSWSGAGAVYIFGREDLAYKGDIPTGLVGQFALADASTGYAASSFPRRILYGAAEAVLQPFNARTLKLGPEIKISEKMALTINLTGMLQITASKRFALVQNATPATSVSVIDLNGGKQIGEIPTPGCYSIITAPRADNFSTLCGDGTLLNIRLDSHGKVASQARSAPFFDPEKDPIFMHAQRVDDDLVFVSYKGVLHRMSDQGEQPVEVDRFDFAAGVDGAWAPGGYQLTAYNAPGKVLFVAMHPNATDGSHKNESKEIWAIDLAGKRVLYRSGAVGFTHIPVTQDDAPQLFDDDGRTGQLARFEVDPEAKFAAKLSQQIRLDELGAILIP